MKNFIISNISGKNRALVKGKGWVDINKLKANDKLKTKDFTWKKDKGV